MTDHRKVLAVDVGSTALSAVTMDGGGRILERFYKAHRGDILRTLTELDLCLDLTDVRGCALTGRISAPVRHDRFYDARMACIRSVKHRFPESRAILMVGAEQFYLIRFDRDGQYESVRTNTSCAAGTGSFLDQQAERLTMSGSAELSATALENGDPVPLVATRCSVFAKTDLIHAQQEGYSLSAISDGLCEGLARNLADTLFKEDDMEGPVVFTGGVSMNESVFRHLSRMIPPDILIDPEGGVQGAVGAGLSLLDEASDFLTPVVRAADLYLPEEPDRSGFSPPLSLNLSEYPDFISYRSWEQPIEGRCGQPMVEVDLYCSWPEELDAYLGIDVGSTSTKAVVTDLNGRVLGGFYTRTSGRPLEAVQALFESVEKAAEREGSHLAVQGSGTTGSGRKFIGKLINADVVLDEISAHARAACELDPDVDTILEIGGQDSKFTTLKNGRVTLSVMNNVCAAGTGSFLEEQAGRLGIPVRDFASLTEGVRAPLVSDRCTVFMERDINYLLSEGHSVPEVLAAALHAVRENYLRKVAVEKHIGKVVFFQGATAKNRSLVAAFEQKLGRPILVSPWCHLTGALGAALTLLDEQTVSDRFVGLDLCRKSVPIRREVCRLCGNHCKLTIADLDGRSEAFGFLCGRDYNTDKYVNRNVSGFDLLKERRSLELSLLSPAETAPLSGDGPVIGLPDGLFMTEDLTCWEVFFRELGLKTLTSRHLRNPIQKGKPLTGAEFCAPVAALHGHAAALLEEADYLFLPVYIERKTGKNGEIRKFCYYSQFVTSLIDQAGSRDRILSPLASTRYSNFQLIGEMQRSLSVLPGYRYSYLQISAALDRADAFRERRDRALKELFRERSTRGETADVLLLGRPYTILSPEMNKGIPDIFGALGIRVFYQDMLEYSEQDVKAIDPLLKEINWTYGARILECAEVAARTPGLYPVLLTSFKCGPDSFITEYVKRILDAHDTPYLVLELDEHDSSVGYETRIEAAVRSFRNHLEGHSPAGSGHYSGVNPRYQKVLRKNRTVILPNWDDYAIPLIVSILNSQGYKACLMEETRETIRRSLKWNNGQCIPMNALLEGFAATVRNHGLKPADCLLWIPYAELSCNIRMFPHHIRELLTEYGEGMEKADVYQGNMTYIDLSPIITANAYLAYMFSGLIRRIACRIRPYEVIPGQTDQAVQASLGILKELFDGIRKNKTQAIQEMMNLFEWIAYDRTGNRPKVALFGDVYVRDNPVLNQDIIGFIEKNGGEVVTMPFHEFTRMTVDTYFRRWIREGKFGRLLSLKPLLAGLATMDKWYYRHFERMLGEPAHRFDENTEEILGKFHVRLDHEGESQDNLLKTWYISRQYPDLSLFIQLNPGFCCAGLVTEAMARRIREVTGVPVLSITYDGTGGFKNDAVLPYLKYPSVRREGAEVRRSV